MADNVDKKEPDSSVGIVMTEESAFYVRAPRLGMGPIRPSNERKQGVISPYTPRY
jgi:hypothetical protein